MSFFPKAYFPDGYFNPGAGGEEQPGFANMAAVLAGAATCLAFGAGSAAGVFAGEGQGGMSAISAPVASFAATLTGSSALHAGLVATTAEPQPKPQQPSSSVRGGAWDDYRRQRQPIAVDLAMSAGGSGALQGTMTGSAAAGLHCSGDGSLKASTVLDITRLLRRRREEEEMAAMLLAAVG